MKIFEAIMQILLIYILACIIMVVFPQQLQDTVMQIKTFVQ